MDPAIPARHFRLRCVSSSHCIDLSDKCKAIAVDDTSVLAVLTDNSLILWDLFGQQQHPSVKFMLPFKEAGSVLCADLNLQWVVAGGVRGCIKIWNRGNGRTVGKFFISHEVNRIRLSPVTGQVCLASNRVLQVWPLSLTVPKAKEYEVIMDKFIADFVVEDGRMLIGSSDGLVHLWDLDRQQMHFRLIGHTKAVTCVSIRGHMGVSGSLDCMIRLWCLRKGEPLKSFLQSSVIKSLAISGVFVFSGAAGGGVLAWDLKECLDFRRPMVLNWAPCLIGYIPGGHQHATDVSCIAIHPTSLITADCSGAIQIRNVWRPLETAASLRLLRLPHWIRCFTADCNLIACGMADGDVLLLQRHNLSLKRCFPGKEEISCVDMTKALVAAGSVTGKVRMWQKDTGMLLFTWTAASPPHPVHSLRFRHNYLQAMSLFGFQAEFELLPEEGGRFTMKERTSSVPDFSVSYGNCWQKNTAAGGQPRDTTITAGRQLELRTEVFRGRQQTVLRSPQNAVTPLEQEQELESRWPVFVALPLVLVARDHQLDVLDCSTDELKVLEHESRVLSAAVHDGRILMVGCESDQLVFWDLAKVRRCPHFRLSKMNHGRHCCIRSLVGFSPHISQVLVSGSELLTDDFNGIICIRKLNMYPLLQSLLAFAL